MWKSILGTSTAIPFDLNNDGTISAATGGTTLTDVYSRQRYAQFLYVLMLLLTNYDPTGAEGYTWAQDFAEFHNNNGRSRSTDGEVGDQRRRFSRCRLDHDAVRVRR